MGTPQFIVASNTDTIAAIGALQSALENEMKSVIHKSADVIYTQAAEFNSTSTSPSGGAGILEFIANYSGDIGFDVELKIASGTANIAVFRNGVQITGAALVSGTDNAYAVKAFAGEISFNKGDTILFRVYTSNGSYAAYARNLHINGALSVPAGILTAI